MSLSSKLGSRFRVEFVAQLIYAISGGVLTVVLARLLGPESYGLLYFALSVLGTIAIFSKLGIARSGAKYIASNNPGETFNNKTILKETLLLNTISILIVTLALLISHQQLSIMLNEPDIANLLLIGVFFIVATTLVRFSRHILQGFEDIKTGAILKAINGVGKTIFALGLVLLSFGAAGALFGYVIAYALTAFIGLVYIYRTYYKDVGGGRNERVRRKIAAYAVPVTATRFADVIDKRVDIIILGFFTSPMPVAFYTISKQVVSFIETPISALGYTLAPTFEAQKARGNPDTAAKIYEEALGHGLLIYIPAAAGIALVSEPLIQIFFGNEYLPAVAVLQILSLYVVCVAIMKITSHALEFLGRARILAIVKGITSVMNVILNILLIPTMGVIGAALATVFTFSIYTISNIYVIHTELDLNMRSISKKVCIIFMITFLMSVAVYWSVNHFGGYLSLLIPIPLGVFIWIVLADRVKMVNFQKIIKDIIN